MKNSAFFSQRALFGVKVVTSSGRLSERRRRRRRRKKKIINRRGIFESSSRELGEKRILFRDPARSFSTAKCCRHHRDSTVSVGQAPNSILKVLDIRVSFFLSSTSALEETVRWFRHFAPTWSLVTARNPRINS